MIALTIAEDIGIGLASVIGLVVFLAAWRGIKIIVVHRRNGEGE